MPQNKPSRVRKPAGKAEARLVALACTDPPDGQAVWTIMKLLADKLVELEVVDAVSDETVHHSGRSEGVARR
jgi:hypothetical protein